MIRSFFTAVVVVYSLAQMVQADPILSDVQGGSVGTENISDEQLHSSGSVGTEGGGDPCWNHINEARKEIRRWILSNEGSQDLQFHDAWSYFGDSKKQSYRDVMLRLLNPNQVKISCLTGKGKHSPIIVDGSAKTCKNYIKREVLHIDCDFTRILQLARSSELLQTVHHEFASLGGIEFKNGTSYSDMFVSNQLDLFTRTAAYAKLGKQLHSDELFQNEASLTFILKDEELGIVSGQINTFINYHGEREAVIAPTHVNDVALDGRPGAVRLRNTEISSVKDHYYVIRNELHEGIVSCGVYIQKRVTFNSMILKNFITMVKATSRYSPILQQKYDLIPMATFAKRGPIEFSEGELKFYSASGELIDTGIQLIHEQGRLVKTVYSDAECETARKNATLLNLN